jgi:hypothetical protein
MGREAEGHALWRGASGAVKALLESDAIILRGEVRGRLPRAGLMGWRIGGPAPDEIAVALAGAEALGPQEAALIVAVLTGPGDLEAALAAGRATGLRVWCVYGKGKAAAVGDATVREAFRAAGWMDIKACAVSEAFTATLYRPPV